MKKLLVFFLIIIVSLVSVILSSTESNKSQKINFKAHSEMRLKREQNRQKKLEGQKNKPKVELVQAKQEQKPQFEETKPQYTDEERHDGYAILEYMRNDGILVTDYIDGVFYYQLYLKPGQAEKMDKKFVYDAFIKAHIDKKNEISKFIVIDATTKQKLFDNNGIYF